MFLVNGLYGFLLDHSDIIAVIGNIATTITIIFLLLEYMFTRRTYRYNCEWQEKNKAAELAALYKNEILDYNFFISLLFQRLGIIGLLKNTYSSELKLFTKSELEDMLSKEDIELIHEKLMDPKNYSYYLECQSFIPAKSELRYLIPEEHILKQVENDSKQADRMKRYIMNRQYMKVVDHLLNSLEYFAMYFNTGVADERVVYQSLHQTYLKVVRAMYFEIARRNDNPKDMYYTNIINLYVKWSERDKKMKEKIQKQNLRVVQKARRIKK